METNAVLYIHGKGGSAEEAAHYKALFPSCAVSGLDYKNFTPWETGLEIRDAVTALKKRHRSVILIANSIGAYFSMHANAEEAISHAYFISPVVDMEKLITGMMQAVNVTEDELRAKGTVPTNFGEDLSWTYLSYVRNHPVKWNVPTDILYGSNDSLTSFETIRAFAGKHRARLTVMENGEHWFHTEEQLRFLDNWIQRSAKENNMQLQTERLILRPWAETDAPICYQYAKDPRVGPICGWQPHTSEENTRQIIRDILSAPETYAIVLKETGLPVGSIALKYHSDLAGKDDEAELGYWLGVPYWGRGIMPEAAREILRHAFEDLRLARVWCGYYDGNEKSKRVQEKLGFEHQWTSESVPVPQMGETRVGHVNLLTKEQCTKH